MGGGALGTVRNMQVLYAIYILAKCGAFWVLFGKALCVQCMTMQAKYGTQGICKQYVGTVWLYVDTI